MLRCSNVAPTHRTNGVRLTQPDNRSINEGNVMPTVETKAPFTHGTTGYLPLCDRQGEVVGWAKVDAEDLDRLARHRWSKHTIGYAVRKQRRGRAQLTIYLGREVLGVPESGSPRIRHVNGDKLDCRRSNLRPATAWINRQLSNPKHAPQLAHAALATVLGTPSWGHTSHQGDES
jgi:hypothetical protein